MARIVPLGVHIPVVQLDGFNIPFKIYKPDDYEEVIERIFSMDDIGENRDFITCDNNDDAVKLAHMLSNDNSFDPPLKAFVEPSVSYRVIVHW
ncbi:hypothetical protein [Proteus mirabilis]|uniref:hypothetical protein n=1 Tax=Proteus mirabilis TaxID=584 RepID=UPI0034D723E1